MIRDVLLCWTAGHVDWKEMADLLCSPVAAGVKPKETIVGRKECATARKVLRYSEFKTPQTTDATITPV